MSESSVLYHHFLVLWLPIRDASRHLKSTSSDHVSFPYQIGYDAAGVVVGVGEGVKSLKVGDEVYTRLPEASRGNTTHVMIVGSMMTIDWD